jgi:hypothetical protein
MAFTLDLIGQLEQKRGVFADGFDQAVTIGVLWSELTVTPNVGEGASFTISPVCCNAGLATVPVPSSPAAR